MILFVALNLMLVSFAAYFLVVPLLRMHRLNQMVLKFERTHRQFGCREHL